MSKILVIYHSQQFGNTKGLAEALAEGVRESGAEVELINTNERRVTLNEFLATDAVAIGTPDYFSYVAGTIKTLFDDIYLWDQAGNPVKGKPAALFFSHGGGGKVKQPLEAFAQRFFQQVGETVEGRRPISDEAKKKCIALGKELVKR
ncbi:MAG: flavodoxin family protein [Deltaproteobacteria bacterium]|jgi:multimeric flavodoxin WrbA|nr:flavodoxin family protein [Deltaproteobacteria bacterium]